MLPRIIFLLLAAALVKCDDKPDLALENTACDLNARNTSCLAGFCCVRDEFLYSETLCRPLGKAGAPCATKLTEFECPCEDGFRCASNIHGHVTSLFGKCYPIPSTDQTTDSTMTTQMSDKHVTTLMSDKHVTKMSDKHVTKQMSDNHVTTESKDTDTLETTAADVKHVQLDGDNIVG